MDGCLALVVFAVSAVLLIAPLISLGVSLQMRSRIRSLEAELRTLRARFDARERRDTRERGEAPEPEVETPPASAPFASAEADSGKEPVAKGKPSEKIPFETAPIEESPDKEPVAAFESKLPDESTKEPGEPAVDLPQTDRGGWEFVDEVVPETGEPPREDARTSMPDGTTAPRSPIAPSRPAPPPPRPPTPPQPTPPRPPFDWEGLVGVKLFSWIAGILFVLAAVFFLKYSIDHGWISPMIRFLTGLATGLGLIVLCEAKFASGYRVTANAFDAAGIATLYATLFAAHDLWKLVSQPVAFVFMVIVTALAVFLSIRRDSAFIALLGLLGGFATPALLATGQDRPFALFGYLLILNAGVAWVAWKKGWPILSLLSLVFTTIYQWAWVIRFLDGPRAPVAIGIFLIFPIAAVMMIWVAKAREPDRPAKLFEWTAQASAILPLLFAFYGAAIPAFGERQSLLFFFLLVVDIGLAVVALAKRMPGILNLLGGVSTVLVFAIWFGLSWSPGAWPSILGWIAAFVVLYAIIPEVARALGIVLDQAGVAARYAAPLLLFTFPVLATLEVRTAEPALLFGVLLGLVALLGILAIRQDATWLYVPGALFAILAEAQWADRHLGPDTLVQGLVIFGLFAAVFAILPMIATRFESRLGTSRSVALPLIGSLFVVMFLTDDRLVSDAFVGLVVIVSGIVIGLQALGGVVRRRVAISAGVLVAWLVLALAWIGLELETSLVRAAVSVAVLATIITLGSIHWAGTKSAMKGDASIYLGLVVYGFIWIAAGLDDLAGRAVPILGLLSFVTILFAVGSILARTPHVHAVSAGLTQLSLVIWCGTVESWSLTFAAVLAAVIAGFLAFMVWRIAGRVGAREIHLHAVAAIASSLIGHFVPIVASGGGWSIDWSFLVMAHLALLVIAFTAAWKTGWHGVVIASVFPTSFAYFWFVDGAAVAHGAAVDLTFATLLYLPFIAYPLALGERAGKTVRPYLAAIVASVPFFFFAKDTLDGIDFEFMAMLPLAQAGLMALLVVRLLGIEPEGRRELGRLALVSGALLAFVTVAIPLQFDREWITIGWALEAAALVWLYRRVPHNGLLAVAGALFGVVFVRLVMNPAVFDYHPRSAVPILNWYLYTYLVPAAAMFSVPYLLEATSDWKRRLRNACSAGGTILLFLLLNIEIADFYSQGTSLTFDFDAGLAQDLTYTIGWALFAIAMLVAGLLKGSRAIRIASLALLVVAIAKCFLHDLMRLGGLYRVGSLVGLAISLAIVALLLQRFVFRQNAGTTDEMDS